VAGNLSLIDSMNARMYVGGQWISANDGATFNVTSPNNKEVVGVVPNGGANETKQAIDAAQDAFVSWSKLTAYKRAEFLLKIRDLMMQYKEELAIIMSTEMGKVYAESCGEVNYAASFFEWFAEEGKRVYGETIPASADNKRLLVIKQPVGVVAAITPWNFPLAMLTRKLGPALAAGCTAIVKPAPQSPLTALAFAKITEMAGLPHGVVNIVTGDAQPISDEIFSHPSIKKVSFTGSTGVGKLLVKKSSERLIKLSLELGGHAPFIVFDDADLEKAAAGALASKFRNAGQTCVCANRIYVQRNVADKFAEILTDKVKALQVGNSLNRDAQIGPLVNEGGLEKVQRHVTDAVAKGAKVLCGGKLASDIDAGYYYEPTVLGDVNDEMLVMFEETFGPVAPVVVFDIVDEIIARANQTPFGLAAYLYTNKLDQAIQVAEALQFGIVGLNDAVPSTAQAPFGGIKESGFGREGGHQGIEEYLSLKYISIQI